MLQTLCQISIHFEGADENLNKELHMSNFKVPLLLFLLYSVAQYIHKLVSQVYR